MILGSSKLEKVMRDFYIALGEKGDSEVARKQTKKGGM